MDRMTVTRTAARIASDLLEIAERPLAGPDAGLADLIEEIASRASGLAARLSGIAAELRGACELCQGLGRIDDMTCWECGGTGARKPPVAGGAP